MADRVSIPNLPTLTNLNWVLWKISIEGYMKQHDLYSFISSDDPIPNDPTEAKTFRTNKMKASGVLQQFMGLVNYQKFANDKNKDDPRAMWLALEKHYQSNAIANQAKVYNDFLGLKFRGTDINQFISDIRSHISNLRAVGLRIGIPKDFEIHKNLFCEAILDKIPANLVHTREVLIQKQPLTIDTLSDLLENRRHDDSTIQIKTEESALRVQSTSTDTKCVNGVHNPNATHIRS
jgi:hypothetical protein